ncbi:MULTISPECIES: replication-relaxation family protein [unclassified Amycolatopsis]|uniref:replication-relaxation family protein n=1 Tax=unclassified Amycolatopsis TaxID=2618356 RepID=UPI001C69EA6E|nr:replication-relaxation family protein [Amycolatopsis sp. DSM 110486]QYN20148.1 replication-relaxation family protein [Amycolatopsis sp. DSM 110486]
MITTTTRQHTLRAHLPGRPSSRSAGSIEHQAMLAARLTHRDKWLLALLHEHRVLTSHQIQNAAFPSGRATRKRLRELYLWRAISRFQPFQQLGSAPMHYVLGPAGAAVLAAEHGLEVRDLGYRHDRAMAIAHNQRLAHTIGVNDFFTSLIAHARHAHTTETALAWWSEARCARHFGDLVIPDSYGRWRAGTHHGVKPVAELEWFLEYDTGTESLPKLGRKLAGYSRLAEATGIATPVLVWLPTTRREAGARTALARVHAGLDSRHLVPVATAAAALLNPASMLRSPADAVWLPLTAERSERGGPRYGLDELTRVWPGLAPPAEPGDEDRAEPREAAVATPYRLPAPLPMPPAATPNHLTRHEA